MNINDIEMRFPDFTDKQSELLLRTISLLKNCENEISNKKLTNTRNTSHALIRVYGRMMLAEYEIFTLLRCGFPESAMGLSRKLYEGLVIIDYLIKYKDDNSTIEKFFDAIYISMINTDINTLKWAEEQGENIGNKLVCLENVLKKFENKYNKKIKKDYWWADVDNFYELTIKTDYSRNYMYKICSNKTHLNVYDCFIYNDNSENGILIGATNLGIETPLWFSLLNFGIATGLIANFFEDSKLIKVSKEINELVNQVDSSVHSNDKKRDNNQRM